MARRVLLRRVWTLAALAPLLGACAASAPSLKQSARPNQPTPPKPQPPKQRLLASLQGIQRPGPVLELLSPAALAVLDTRRAALTSEQREQLVSGDLGQAMPLLHLRAGGGSGLALFALATTPTALQELPSAFELLGQASDDDRLRIVGLAHDLAQRAALHFLRDRVLDVGSAPVAALPPLLAAVERAALAAERPDIVRLALETWADLGAPADVLGRLGAACAFDQDEKCLEQALAQVAEATPEHARLLGLRRVLRSLGDRDPVVKAWSLLRLGRYADARSALSAVQSRAKSDLRVAAAIAVVAADGTACPGLQPAVGSPRLCADAVKARSGLSAALSDMDAAWQSKAGRDAASAEAYIGLAHVVPWVAELAVAVDADSLSRHFSERYAALSRALQELPEQRPLAVFSAALAAGVAAGLHVPHGERPRIDLTQKQELWFAALGVEAAAPRLAVSSILAADQSVLELLPKAAPASLVPARAGLLAWEAAGSSDGQLLESARVALIEQLGGAPKGSPESASVVLLLAELDAVAAPSQRTHQALAQVASQLIGEALPPELALRGVLDAAGALERLGRTADALGVLRKAAEIQSLPGPAADLLALIRAEKLVLEWDPQRDPARKQLAKELAAVPIGAPPPTVAFVIGAWGSPKLLRGGKQSPKALLEERIGVRAAELMARGALRGTRISLRVSYAFQSGVTPEVTFDPMLVPLVRPDLIQKAL